MLQGQQTNQTITGYFHGCEEYVSIYKHYPDLRMDELKTNYCLVIVQGSNLSYYYSQRSRAQEGFLEK